MSHRWTVIFFENAFKWSLAFIFVLAMGWIFLPFIFPALLAGIVALAMEPFVRKLELKQRMSRLWAIVACVTALLIVAILPAALALSQGISMLVEWGKGLIKPDANSIEQMPIVQKLLSLGQKISAYFDVDFAAVQSKALEAITQAGTVVAGLFGAFLAQIPDWGFQFFMFILFLIWFLLEAKYIRKGFNKIAKRSGFDGSHFVSVWRLHSQSVLISNMITGAVQALLIATGGLIFGVGNFFVVLVITFICSFIPVVGAAPVGALMALFCFFDSRVGAGIGMLIVAIGTGLADNILRPYLLKGDTESSPLLSLFAVIGGVIVMGLPGLFIAPLIVSLAIATFPIIFQRELVEVEVEVEVKVEGSHAKPSKSAKF